MQLAKQFLVYDEPTGLPRYDVNPDLMCIVGHRRPQLVVEAEEVLVPVAELSDNEIDALFISFVRAASMLVQVVRQGLEPSQLSQYFADNDIPRGRILCHPQDMQACSSMGFIVVSDARLEPNEAYAMSNTGRTGLLAHRGTESGMMVVANDIYPVDLMADVREELLNKHIAGA